MAARKRAAAPWSPSPAVGDVLYGYCGGRFGRDSYGVKRVEAVSETGDWIVVREGEGDEATVNFTALKPGEYAKLLADSRAWHNGDHL